MNYAAAADDDDDRNDDYNHDDDHDCGDNHENNLLQSHKVLHLYTLCSRSSPWVLIKRLVICAIIDFIYISL